MSELSQAKARPVGVTILAILAAIHALQFLGLIPFVIGHVVAVQTTSASVMP